MLWGTLFIGNSIAITRTSSSRCGSGRILVYDLLFEYCYLEKYKKGSTVQWYTLSDKSKQAESKQQVSDASLVPFL